MSHFRYFYGDLTGWIFNDSVTKQPVFFREAVLADIHQMFDHQKQHIHI